MYTHGYTPQLLDGECGITKAPVAVALEDGIPPLSVASRIYYGIHHPIQYNVKVKNIGCIIDDDLSVLFGNWREEPEAETSQAHDSNPRWHGWMDDKSAYSMGVQASATLPGNRTDNTSWKPCEQQSQPAAFADNPPWYPLITQSPSDLSTTSTSTAEYEFVNNPRAFFKKGRFFMTLWSEPKGFSEAERAAIGAAEQTFVEPARFVVVKPKSTHCICLRISTYSGQATAKPGVAASEHAAVLPLGGSFQPHPRGESQMTKDPIFIKLENPDVSIDPMSRINFGKPYTVEYNIKVRKLGRVYGESVAKMDEYFAESLGLTRAV